MGVNNLAGKVTLALHEQATPVLMQFRLSDLLLLGTQAPSPALRRRRKWFHPLSVGEGVINFALRAHCGRGRPRSQHHRNCLGGGAFGESSDRSFAPDSVNISLIVPTAESMLDVSTGMKITLALLLLVMSRRLSM